MAALLGLALALVAARVGGARTAPDDLRSVGRIDVVARQEDHLLAGRNARRAIRHLKLDDRFFFLVKTLHEVLRGSFQLFFQD